MKKIDWLPKRATNLLGDIRGLVIPPGLDISHVKSLSRKWPGTQRFAKYVRLTAWLLLLQASRLCWPQDTVTVPGGAVFDGAQCYFSWSDPKFNEQLRRLAVAIFGVDEVKNNGTLGCLTFPYRGAGYNVFGNDVHAGVDLRSKAGRPVYSIEAGTVVHINFCLKDKTSQAALCKSKDGKEHSTVIVENAKQTRKVLYLHLSEIDAGLVEGSSIPVGTTLGKSGGVGATQPHVHVEAWPSSSSEYKTRNAAITGSACGNGRCTDADIARLTQDPTVTVGVSESANDFPPTPVDGGGSSAVSAAACDLPIEKPGMSGQDAQAALGPARDTDRADAIYYLVKGDKFRIPQCGPELGLALTGATEAHRARAIKALATVVQANLSGEDAAAILGTVKECSETNRADAIYYLAEAKKFKPILSGKELGMILDGTTGAARARAIQAISAK